MIPVGSVEVKPRRVDDVLVFVGPAAGCVAGNVDCPGVEVIYCRSF